MQPLSEGGFCYRSRVDKRPDPRSVLWANVRALMVWRYGKENLTRFAADTKLGPGTISRLKAQETFAQLDTLDAIAEEFDLFPWQLLVPGFEATNPPVIASASPDERKLYKGFLAFKKAIESPDNDK
jgi:hypothetical protein